MLLSEKIKNIPKENINNIVFNQLWLEIKKNWLSKYQVNWHKGLIYDSTENIMTDFAWKHFLENQDYIINLDWSFTSKIIWIIQYSLSVDKTQAIKRLEDNWVITETEKTSIKEINKFEKAFFASKNNNDLTKLKEYLRKRKIEYEKVKNLVSFYDTNNNLVLLWKDEKGQIVNIHKRNIKTKLIYKEQGETNDYFFCDKIKKNKSYLVVEWEIDFLTLLCFEKLKDNYNIIWIPWLNGYAYFFKSIWNKKAFVIPDNDETEKKVLKEIEKLKGSNIYLINNFLKEKSIKDVNDYNMLYSDLEEKIQNEIEQETQEEERDIFTYIKTKLKYYWVKKGIYCIKSELKEALQITEKQLQEKRKSWEIKTYEDTIYRQWWKKRHYNLLDENSILKSNNNPVLNPNIKLLIGNICNNNQKNIEWLCKAILYKYYNINDFDIPSVMFYGVWGSGKWTFMKLLSKIFWKENTLVNLGYRDLAGNFDMFKGDKIIVEYAEVLTHNKRQDKIILNKLKSMIWQEEIIINQKGVKQYQANNIARFFFTSNDNKPLHLDSKRIGNRRFTIINSNQKLAKNKAKDIHKTLENKNSIASFIAWLEKNYLEEITERDYILEALENEEKTDLEYKSLEDTDLFREEITEKYKDWDKLTIDKISEELDTFAIKIWIWINEVEPWKILRKYLRANSPYSKKKISINWRKLYWIIIKK